MPTELKFSNKRFEETVRQALNICDRPIYDSDAILIERLECDFWFDEKDCEVLRAFSNLKELGIEGGSWLLPAISTLAQLEVLYLTGGNDENGVDFRSFFPLKALTKLMVSGGAYSSMNLRHLEALVELKNLTDLCLHEFGNVDLKPLENMVWLKSLFCGYAASVENVEIIRNLVHLEYLELVDFEVEDLCFVEASPETMELTIGGLRIKQQYDLTRLKRFKTHDIYENTVAGQWIS